MSPALQGGEELVGEGLDRRVADAEPAAVGEDVVADRVQQVGLADARRSVDEERVVGVAGELGHGQGGGVGEAVGVADDELLEGQLRVDPVLGRARGGQLRSGGPGAGAALGGRARAHVDGDLGSEDRRDAAPAVRARSARRPRRAAHAGPRPRGRRPRGRAPAGARARRRTCQPGPPGAARPGWRSRCARGPRSRQGQSAPRQAAFGGRWGEEAALGTTGAATIATGWGPNAGLAGGLWTHVANREQNRRRGMHTPVHDVCEGSVDNVRALDWRAGHSTLPLP